MLLCATIVSFANDKLDPEVILLSPPTAELYQSANENSSDKPMLISEEYNFSNELNEDMIVNFNDEKVKFDILPTLHNGMLMIPLSAVLNSADYKYEWKSETGSVDIIKGAQFTTVYIGKNQYFKNKMAPHSLSSEAIIVDGRTLVPVEFFNEVLGFNISLKDNVLDLSIGEMAIHTGYITEFNKSEKGNISITLTKVKGSTEMSDIIIIHTQKASTIFNNSNIRIGEFVNVISPMYMTMSIPAQTSGIVIY